MTLSQLSPLYEESAWALRRRIRQLRAQQPATPEASAALDRRIRALVPLLRGSRELAELTRHYYDRSFYRNERYTL